MAFNKSKIARIVVAFVLVLFVFGIGVRIRVKFTLPFFDLARFHHWLGHEEWTALADEVWQESIIDSVRMSLNDEAFQSGDSDFTFDVVAEDWDAMISDGVSSVNFDVPLSSDREERYAQLFAAVDRFTHMDRTETSIRTEGGGAQRFGRQFAVDLVSPRDGYVHLDKCNDQYKRLEKGTCEVSLGPDWLLQYYWWLPYEMQVAKCAGIWRELANDSSVDLPEERLLIGAAQDLEYVMQDLGQAQVDEWMSKGADAARAARSTGSEDDLSRLLEECSY